MRHITVIGGGTMGNGIAQVMATFGYEVTLCDISADALEKAIKTISGSLDRMIKRKSYLKRTNQPFWPVYRRIQICHQP